MTTTFSNALEQFRMWARENEYAYNNYKANVIGCGGGIFQVCVFVVILPIKYYLVHHYWPYPWWWDSVYILAIATLCMFVSFILASIHTWRNKKQRTTR